MHCVLRCETQRHILLPEQRIENITFLISCNALSKTVVFFQLHVVFRIQQSRQWKSSVKTLRSPLFANSGGIGETQRRAFTSTPDRSQLLNLLSTFSFYKLGMLL